MPADDGYDPAAFAALQRRLAPMWSRMTLRHVPQELGTVVMVSSIDLDLPPSLAPMLPAYEERYLAYVLLLAKTSDARVVYVTSQPILPRLAHYFLDLLPGARTADALERLSFVSVGDSSIRPLSEKVLERPRLLHRLRSLVVEPERSLLLPFMTTPLEARLGLEIGVPVYGADPRLAPLGSKRGSRAVFAAAGVDHPAGVDVRDAAELPRALLELRRSSGARSALVKADDGVSGFGNALVDLSATETVGDAEAALMRLQPGEESLDPEGFLAVFDAAGGGVVEERLSGARFRSPSVQMRASPLREVEVLSTHDQLLGGPHDQVYLGCRYPADPGYRADLLPPARAIGAELAARGVIGRFAVDFVATAGRTGPWRLAAVEVNLRNGGTTHPAVTLQALTDAAFDPATGELVAGGHAKHYVATDHLEDPALRRLTPDDLLDVVAESHLGWDPDRMTGFAFHMASAVAVRGCVGVTAIGNSADDAQRHYDAAAEVLRAAASAS